MQQSPYDLIMSLGYNCACAYQIRLHTRCVKHYFFDWLYTSPSAATKVLQQRFSGILASPEQAPIVRDGLEVMDIPTGLRFNHSFKSGGKSVLPELYSSGFETERTKFEIVGKKTLDAIVNASHPLFLRWCPYSDRIDTPDQAEVLLATLRELNPRCELRILCNASQTPSHANVEYVALTQQPERSSSFHGTAFVESDDVAWGAWFSTIAWRLDGPTLGIGEPVLRGSYDGAT